MIRMILFSSQNVNLLKRTKWTLLFWEIKHAKLTVHGLFLFESISARDRYFLHSILGKEVLKKKFNN